MSLPSCQCNCTTFHAIPAVADICDQRSWKSACSSLQLQLHMPGFQKHPAVSNICDCCCQLTASINATLCICYMRSEFFVQSMGLFPRYNTCHANHGSKCTPAKSDRLWPGFSSGSTAPSFSATRQSWCASLQSVFAVELSHDAHLGYCSMGKA